jgi:hypothetical protein
VNLAVLRKMNELESQADSERHNCRVFSHMESRPKNTSVMNDRGDCSGGGGRETRGKERGMKKINIHSMLV